MHWLRQEHLSFPCFPFLRIIIRNPALLFAGLVGTTLLIKVLKPRSAQTHPIRPRPCILPDLELPSRRFDPWSHPSLGKRGTASLADVKLILGFTDCSVIISDKDQIFYIMGSHSHKTPVWIRFAPKQCPKLLEKKMELEPMLWNGYPSSFGKFHIKEEFKWKKFVSTIYYQI